MIRAFAAQLGSSSGSSATGGSALATVLQGLWQYYSQVFSSTGITVFVCGVGSRNGMPDPM